MNFRKIASATMTVVAVGFFVGPANASLVLLSPANFGGTGLGAVNTILTIQSPGSSSNETGSVGRVVGNPNDVVLNNAKTGASQTQTRTISSLGLTSAANLRVVFNAVEPGGDNITLNDLQLTFFSPAGTVLFNSGIFTPVPFINTFTGAGNSGFVFGLDATQAAAAQAAAFGSGFGSNLIGLGATASNATGGVETFFVANSPGGGGGGTAIPEPGTIALFGAGLLALVARRRRS